MIGVYDYTVILTYLSAISASLGILFALTGTGHPYIGAFFLLFCGFCDAFDGKVARTKKDRTTYEKKFGVQIDSLSDLLAFGVLPVCIGVALLRVSPKYHEVLSSNIQTRHALVTTIVFYGIMMIYIIFGLTRLAHYNVTEDERQSVETGNRKYFQGLPITSAAFIFPTVLFLQCVLDVDMTITYYVMMFFVSVAFVVDVKIPKPGTREILILVGIGLLEAIVLIVTFINRT